MQCLCVGQFPAIQIRLLSTSDFDCCGIAPIARWLEKAVHECLDFDPANTLQDLRAWYPDDCAGCRSYACTAIEGVSDVCIHPGSRCSKLDDSLQNTCCQEGGMFVCIYVYTHVHACILRIPCRYTKSLLVAFRKTAGKSYIFGFSVLITHECFRTHHEHEFYMYIYKYIYIYIHTYMCTMYVPDVCINMTLVHVYRPL